MTLRSILRRLQSASTGIWLFRRKSERLSLIVSRTIYSYLFGKKATLAKKPKPWRMSLLLEVLYGGWTLIRDTILPAFSACKDIEYLTLLNLVDNYIPLVLSLYSIIFKCNDYENYYLSLLRCWVMMMVYQRRHYDKALLIALSLFDHWKTNSHPFHQAMVNALSAFDEYPVENSTPS